MYYQIGHILLEIISIREIYLWKLNQRIKVQKLNLLEFCLETLTLCPFSPAGPKLHSVKRAIYDEKL